MRETVLKLPMRSLRWVVTPPRNLRALPFFRGCMNVNRKGIIGLIQMVMAALIIIPMAPAFSSEMVTIKSTGQDTVIAKLTRPPGTGPFPAIILLHGAIGFDKHYDDWAARLVSWGYVALLLDSFGRRGQSSRSDPPSTLAQDICYAKSYLSELPVVDPKRIGVIGWSQRGSAALATLCTRFSSHQGEYPLRAVAIFYPYCFRALADLNFPLLILIGELDDRSPVSICLERMPHKRTENEVILKVYPRAYHGFDVEGIDTSYLDRRYRYSSAAAADSIVQVKAFLAKYLK
jgi:dienelactone hydrolase